jgi:hypothetical protein
VADRADLFALLAKLKKGDLGSEGEPLIAGPG